MLAGEAAEAVDLDWGAAGCSWLRAKSDLSDCVMPTLAVNNRDPRLMRAPGWECTRISVEVPAEARASLGERELRQEAGPPIWRAAVIV